MVKILVVKMPNGKMSLVKMPDDKMSDDRNVIGETPLIAQPENYPKR